MDFSTLSDEDLTNFLLSYGVSIDDALSYDRENKEMILNSLQMDEQPMHTQERQSSNMMPSEEIDSRTNLFEYETTANLGTQKENTHIDELTQDRHQMDENPSMDDLMTPDNTEEETRKIASFCDITGCDASFARSLLEAMGWDLDTSMTLYLEGEGGANLVSSRPRAPLADISLHGTRVLPNRVHPLEEHNFNMDPVRQIIHSMSRHVRFADDALAENSDDDDDHMVDTSFHPDKLYDEYDEDGIRRPDPIRMQRLVPASRQGSDEDGGFSYGRIEDPSAEWMFDPPRHLNSIELFNNAKQSSLANNKWLLVNIQSHFEFQSHELNRDTWTDETIKALIISHFTLWQRGHTSRDGQDFSRLYRLKDDDLPCICIIDPNTGAKRFSWTGYITPVELADKLVNFLDEHKIPASLPAPAPAPIISGPADQLRLNESPFPTIPPVESTSTSEEPAMAETSDKAKYDPTVFGIPPPEPDVSDSNAIRVSVKLSSGKAITRRYSKTETVRALFAVAITSDPESSTKSFDLISRFPAINLLSHLDRTLEDAQLAGGQVFHRWL